MTKQKRLFVFRAFPFSVGAARGEIESVNFRFAFFFRFLAAAPVFCVCTLSL